jgi:hypothetical protein
MGRDAVAPHTFFYAPTTHIIVSQKTIKIKQFYFLFHFFCLNLT